MHFNCTRLTLTFKFATTLLLLVLLSVEVMCRHQRLQCRHQPRPQKEKTHSSSIKTTIKSTSTTVSSSKTSNSTTTSTPKNFTITMKSTAGVTSCDPTTCASQGHLICKCDLLHCPPFRYGGMPCPGAPPIVYNESCSAIKITSDMLCIAGQKICRCEKNTCQCAT